MKLPCVVLANLVGLRTSRGRVHRVRVRIPVLFAVLMVVVACSKGDPTSPSASPSLATSTIVATPDSITADGSSTTTLEVQLRTAIDSALSRSAGRVELQATAGTLGPVTDHQDGQYTATLTAPTTAGAATISASLDGAALTSKPTVTFVAGPPSLAASTLTARDSVLTADGVAATVVVVHVRDAHGNAITSGGGAVTLQATAGTLGPVAQAGDSAYAMLTAPSTVGGATVSAKLGGQPLTATVSVRFAPGSPASFVFSGVGGGALPTTDAGHPFAVAIVALDAHGNRASTFSGSVTITSTGSLSRGAGTSPTFVAGVVASDTLTLSDGGAFTITATASNGAGGTSPPIAVRPGVILLVSSNTLWAVNADGSNPTQLPVGGAPPVPAWSRDGARISITTGGCCLYTANADGSNLTLISGALKAHSIGFSSSWSPTGSQIVFAAADSLNGTAIYRVNSDGTSLVSLTDSSWDSEAPAWSPDGTKIAFQHQGTPGGEETIYLMNPDGSGVVQLTAQTPGVNYDTYPAWSPDGTRLAFARAFQGTGLGGAGGPVHIFVIGRDGSGLTDLTPDITTNPYVEPPSWSPDGTRIAFSMHGGWLVIMNADGTNRHTLLYGADFPAWRP